MKHLVFSSTAAVYGDSAGIADHGGLSRFRPVNPYGESKVMVETLLGWFDQIHGLTSVCLRYFNASGADPEGGLGEEHEPETHLIPLLLRAVQTGKPVTVFGDDYDTPDGTCIRDYIHVNDLAQAHILAVEYLMGGGASDQFNVGTGTGHTVLEMIHAVEEVTGKKVPYVIGPRREGDPPSLVAASGKLRERWDGRRGMPICRRLWSTPGSSRCAIAKRSKCCGCSRSLRMRVSHPLLLNRRHAGGPTAGAPESLHPQPIDVAQHERAAPCRLRRSIVPFHFDIAQRQAIDAFHDQRVCGALVRRVFREHLHAEPFDRDVLQRAVRVAENGGRAPRSPLRPIDRDVLDPAERRFRRALLQHELEDLGAAPPVPVAAVQFKRHVLETDVADRAAVLHVDAKYPVGVPHHDIGEDYVTDVRVASPCRSSSAWTKKRGCCW